MGGTTRYAIPSSAARSNLVCTRAPGAMGRAALIQILIRKGGQNGGNMSSKPDRAIARLTSLATPTGLDQPFIEMCVAVGRQVGQHVAG
jgi:hypothetical protein